MAGVIPNTSKIGDVSAHNGFSPWSEPTVFATGEPCSVLPDMGRIDRVYNRCQRAPWTKTTINVVSYSNWEMGCVGVDLV